MQAIVFREKHKRRIYLLVAAILVLVWFYFRGFPGFGGGECSAMVSSSHNLEL